MTDRLVRLELRPLLEARVLRNAFVRVEKIASCSRCKISARARDGSALSVRAVGATRRRAVVLAVRKLGVALDHHTAQKEAA